MTTDHTAALSALRDSLHGALLTPADPEWDAARVPWNRAVDQHPRAIAVPSGVDDVRAVFAAARATGSRVTVQPRGHGASGDLADSILVRPERFDEVTIDVPGRRARVGAGVTWGTVLTALDGTGLVALAGSNPSVSVVGYTLAGGHSAFSRAFGLAAGAVLAVELVLADGSLVRVDAQSDPDLFWAVRGGCGLLGVVTTVEFALFPLASTASTGGALYGGKLTYPATSASAVLHAVSAVAPTLPDDVSISAMMMTLPDAPVVPEPLRGATICTVDVVSLRGADDTESLIAPVRRAADPIADTIAAFGVADLPAVAAEPVAPMAALHGGALLSTFDADAVDTLLAAFAAASPLGLSMLQMRPLGGAIARPTGDEGIAGVIDAPLLVGMSMILPEPPAGPVGAAPAIESVLAALQSTRAPGLVASFLSAGDDLSRAYAPDAIERLRGVVSRVDPDAVMRSNRPLPA